MSIACIVCVRLRIVPLRLATAVAVLGGIGPFFGSFEFVRESRRREAIRPPVRARVSPGMAASATTGQTIDVVTPAAGESVTEGTILEWRVKVGDPIKLDDTIVEISTDKVDVELPSPASGTVSEILVQEGDTVTVGQVIARIAVGDGAGAPPAAL